MTEKPGYTAIGQLKGREALYLPEDRLNRCLSLLYAYHQLLKPLARKHPAPRLRTPDTREEDLSRDWWAARTKFWRRKGRFNRYGLLIPRPLEKSIPLPRLRKAFPDLDRSELLDLRAFREGRPSRMDNPFPTY